MTELIHNVGDTVYIPFEITSINIDKRGIQYKLINKDIRGISEHISISQDCLDYINKNKGDISYDSSRD